MKKQSILLVMFLLVSISVFAQIVNDGGSIIVNDNSNLYLENDIKNNNGLLQLKNNSTLELEGNFINENGADFDALQGSTVKFFGTQSKIVKSGGDDFAKIIIDKEAATVSLDDNMDIVENLEFVSGNNSKLVIGANNLTLENNASVIGANSDNYIQADGTGFVNKIYSNPENFTFPVGDNDEYSPLEVNVTEGTFGGSSSVGVNVVDEVHPNLPPESSDCHISRYWNIEESNITDFKATLTGTYVEADAVGNCDNISGVSYDDTNWSFDNSQGNNLTVTGDISNPSTDFTGIAGKILDVSFIDINVEAVDDNSCIIRWSLVSDPNIESFEVERSADMIGWQSVGSLVYSQTEESINKYFHLDENIPIKNNIVYYYRIKVIYFDGLSEYSDARFVNFAQYDNNEMVVFPNPATSEVIHYNLPKKISNNINNIMLVDSKGMIILHSELSNESNSGIGVINLTNYDITKGVYFFLAFDNSGNTYKRKVVITD